MRENQNGQEMEKDIPGKSELILYQTEYGKNCWDLMVCRDSVRLSRILE
ncbi:MAG: hypothetical protein HY879_08650 [Deltaproteobacteria bacterium]|nr:hypothetical protein [Deltaproteobacteria bacterium]